MSDKYKNCQGRLNHSDKQSGQRAMDKLFKSLTGRVNPPRKKEDERFWETVRALEGTNSNVFKELSSFLGMNGR